MAIRGIVNGLPVSVARICYRQIIILNTLLVFCVYFVVIGLVIFGVIGCCCFFMLMVDFFGMCVGFFCVLFCLFVFNCFVVVVLFFLACSFSRIHSDAYFFLIIIIISSSSSSISIII